MELVSLQDRLEAVAADLAESRQREAGMRADWLLAERELASAREANRRRANALSPATEGVWPAGKPYFYLRKETLRKLSYVSGNDGKFSPLVKDLFGMTDTEFAKLEAALDDFGVEVRRLRAQRATPFHDLAPDTANHRELAFQIPPLAGEIGSIQQKFEAAVLEALGGERASLLLERQREAPEFSPTFVPSSPVQVRLSADRGADGKLHHQLEIVSLIGGGWTSRSEVTYPIWIHDALWPYQNLFGKEPLIPEPPPEDDE